MEQSVRLSRSQLKNGKKKAMKELMKKKQQDQKSSSSSEGKIMVGLIEMNESKTESNPNIQIQLEYMKALISRYEETIFNQGEKIRELMNNIDDQNNELTILRRQLIKNNLVTEQQLYEQSQSNFKQEQNMIIENVSPQKQDQEKQFEIIDLTLLKRIDKLEKKFFLNNLRNSINLAGTATLNFTYYDNAQNENNLNQKKNREHEGPLIHYLQHRLEYIGKNCSLEKMEILCGNHPHTQRVVVYIHIQKNVRMYLVESPGKAKHLKFLVSQKLSEQNELINKEQIQEIEILQ